MSESTSSPQTVDYAWWRAELRRERRREASSEIFERRNARARAAGWRSYGQMRYWLPRFGLQPDGTVETDAQERTARRLARRVCPENGGIEHRRHRPNSYFCARCDMTVNGDGQSYAPDGTRRGDWRARLVQAYLAA